MFKLNRFLSFLIIPLFMLGLIMIYHVQVGPANYYLGYMDIELNLSYLGLVFFSLCVFFVFIPLGIKKPSDIFAFVFGMFVILPYIIFFPIRGEIDLFIYLENLFYLFFPIVVIRLLSLAKIKVIIPIFFTSRLVFFIILGMTVFGTLLAFLKAPSSAGFTIDDSYVRRIEGRDVYSRGSLQAYLNAMIVNGFAPYLAFIGVLNKKYLVAFAALVPAIVFYYLLGSKAPIIYIFMSYYLGYLLKSRSIYNLPSSIILVCCLTLFIFLIEYYFNQYSIVADYFHRRAFTVPPFVLACFFDLIQHGGWTLTSGINAPNGITFLVGEIYFNNPNTNANTNAFIYELASNGFIVYFLVVLLVSSIFTLMDTLYFRRKDYVLMFIAFFYSLLLMEQSATTALLSSGFGILIFLNTISSSSMKNKTIQTIN